MRMMHNGNGTCAALVKHLKRKTPTISDEGSLTNHTLLNKTIVTYHMQM